MTKFRGLLLAAAFTAGVPALALAQDRPDDQHHGEHGGNGGGHEHGERGGQPAPQQPAPQAQPQAHQAPPQQAPQPQGQPQRGGRPDQGQPHAQDFRGDRGAPGGYRPDQAQQQHPQDFRGNRGDRNGFAPGLPGGQGGYRPDQQRADGYHGGQYGGRPGDRGDFHGAPGQGFAHDWRNDRRFDWRGYRDQHRDIFRAGRYFAPQGWGYGYRAFGIGARIPSFFFGEQYWIADPSIYRLPPAYGPYRWVRYYNDVLLIDLRSGEVVDSIPGFFW